MWQTPQISPSKFVENENKHKLNETTAYLNCVRFCLHPLCVHGPVRALAPVRDGMFFDSLTHRFYTRTLLHDCWSEFFSSWKVEKEDTECVLVRPMVWCHWSSEGNRNVSLNKMKRGRFYWYSRFYGDPMILRKVISINVEHNVTW